MEGYFYGVVLPDFEETGGGCECEFGGEGGGLWEEGVGYVYVAAVFEDDLGMGSFFGFLFFWLVGK